MASYDDGDQSFTLSVSSNAGKSKHFLYQTLDVDATLTARVQNLVTTSPDAKAGLMIRASNDPASAYALVALTPTGIHVESFEGDTAQVAHVDGSSATAPVWLKIERKEDSVYVYESDDGVNFTLITTIALSLASPFNVGLAVSITNEQVQAEFNDVLVQRDSGDELTQIPGNPAERVAEAIPFILYVPNLDDYDTGLEEFTGDLLTARNVLHLTFAESTTIAEANQLLRDIDAVVIGGLPGGDDITKGRVTIRIPTESQEDLFGLYNELQTDPNLAFVVPEVILGDPLYKLSPEEPEPGSQDLKDGGNSSSRASPQIVTNPGQDRNGITAPSDWSWEIRPSGGNWGLEKRVM